MRKVRVDEAAARELEEAAAWYEAESLGTGVRLIDAFENALTILSEEPFPLVRVPGSAGRLDANRLILHRFPFDLIVVEEGDDLVVIAVAHHARRPGYWMDRLST